MKFVAEFCDRVVRASTREVRHRLATSNLLRSNFLRNNLPRAASPILGYDRNAMG
jgi:hypothetical protein